MRTQKFDQFFPRSFLCVADLERERTGATGEDFGTVVDQLRTEGHKGQVPSFA